MKIILTVAVPMLLASLCYANEISYLSLISMKGFFNYGAIRYQGGSGRGEGAIFVPLMKGDGKRVFYFCDSETYGVCTPIGDPEGYTPDRLQQLPNIPTNFFRRLLQYRLRFVQDANAYQDLCWLAFYDLEARAPLYDCGGYKHGSTPMYYDTWVQGDTAIDKKQRIEFFLSFLD